PGSGLLLVRFGGELLSVVREGVLTLSLMLSRPGEGEFGEILLNPLQMPVVRREIGQRAVDVFAEIMQVFLAETAEIIVVGLHPLRRHDPAGGAVGYALETALHPVFLFQPRGDDVELQLPDDADYPVGAVERLEDL